VRQACAADQSLSRSIDFDSSNGKSFPIRAIQLLAASSSMHYAPASTGASSSLDASLNHFIVESIRHKVSCMRVINEDDGEEKLLSCWLRPIQLCPKSEADSGVCLLSAARRSQKPHTCVRRLGKHTELSGSRRNSIIDLRRMLMTHDELEDSESHSAGSDSTFLLTDELLYNIGKILLSSTLDLIL
jgi:hypothetical protein